MLKKLLSVLLVVMLVFSVAACGKAEVKTGNVNIYVLSGPTGIGAVNLWAEAEAGTTENTYKFTLAGANDEIVSAISNGSADIAAVATNLASTLYNKTNGGVTVLAVNTKGVLSILKHPNNTAEINTFTDLKGKTIYTPGQGANPEYILNYVLKGNNIDPTKDLTIQFVGEGSELLSVWAKNNDAIIMAPQPVATTLKIKQNAVTLFDMTAEWDKIATESALVQGCVIVRNEFLKQNPGVVKTFLKEYEESVNKALSDVDTTANYCEKYGIIPAAAVAKQAIPNCGLTFLAGKDMKADLSGFLKVMYEANDKSVGGKLPNDDFYYEAK